MFAALLILSTFFTAAPVREAVCPGVTRTMQRVETALPHFDESEVHVGDDSQGKNLDRADGGYFHSRRWMGAGNDTGRDGSST